MTSSQDKVLDRSTISNSSFEDESRGRIEPYVEPRNNRTSQKEDR